jgi:hypothetical protein
MMVSFQNRRQGLQWLQQRHLGGLPGEQGRRRVLPQELLQQQREDQGINKNRVTREIQTFLLHILFFTSSVSVAWGCRLPKRAMSLPVRLANPEL